MLISKQDEVGLRIMTELSSAYFQTVSTTPSVSHIVAFFPRLDKPSRECRQDQSCTFLSFNIKPGSIFKSHLWVSKYSIQLDRSKLLLMILSEILQVQFVILLSIQVCGKVSVLQKIILKEFESVSNSHIYTGCLKGGLGTLFILIN